MRMSGMAKQKFDLAMQADTAETSFPHFGSKHVNFKKNRHQRRLNYWCVVTHGSRVTTVLHALEVVSTQGLPSAGFKGHLPRFLAMPWEGRSGLDFDRPRHF